jgi:hypothetical protein
MAADPTSYRLLEKGGGDAKVPGINDVKWFAEVQTGRCSLSCGVVTQTPNGFSVVSVRCTNNDQLMKQPANYQTTKQPNYS